MFLKEFGFDIKDMCMRWGGWVFLRNIKMFISNFFNEKKNIWFFIGFFSFIYY